MRRRRASVSLPAARWAARHSATAFVAWCASSSAAAVWSLLAPATSSSSLGPVRPAFGTPMSTTSLPARCNSSPTPNRGGPLGVARGAALACIRAYQLVMSPWLGAHCRLAPYCYTSGAPVPFATSWSACAADAIRRHGLVLGGWYGLRRLARCHPLHPGGYDPVP